MLLFLEMAFHKNQGHNIKSKVSEGYLWKEPHCNKQVDFEWLTQSKNRSQGIIQLTKVTEYVNERARIRPYDLIFQSDNATLPLPGPQKEMWRLVL